MIYLVTYDLRKQGQDYSSLHKAIKAYPTWAHALASTWFVSTTVSCAAVRDNLQKYIDSNDILFVTQLTTTWGSYGLSQEVREWLRRNGLG